MIKKIYYKILKITFREEEVCYNDTINSYNIANENGK